MGVYQRKSTNVQWSLFVTWLTSEFTDKHLAKIYRSRIRDSSFMFVYLLRMAGRFPVTNRPPHVSAFSAKHQTILHMRLIGKN